MLHIFLGTKAQLIKMAPVMRELQQRKIQYNFIFSGQHKDTISDLMKNFDIKEPDVVLYSGSDITNIWKMLIWIIKIIAYSVLNGEKVWLSRQKGVVLNHGDTFSTLAGTILGKIAGHKCAHVESGLRSFNLFHPFPEELTRIIVFGLSDVYLCQDESAKRNLARYNGQKIITHANTLYDALHFMQARADYENHQLLPKTAYAIVSFHRFENIFNRSRLEKIVDILVNVSKNIRLLIVMHKPTIQRLKSSGLIGKLVNENIELRPRYDYKDFIFLVDKSEFVITDGGSNQEECFYMGKPCILLREATERHEGIGENVVVSEYKVEVIEEFVSNYQSYTRPSIIMTISPSKLIVDSLVLEH